MDQLLTIPGRLWVVWPFFGWGMGISLHWFLAGKRVLSGKSAKVYQNIKAEETANRLEQLGRQ